MNARRHHAQDLPSRVFPSREAAIADAMTGALIVAAPGEPCVITACAPGCTVDLAQLTSAEFGALRAECPRCERIVISAAGRA
jgi:hypothetical protein